MKIAILQFNPRLGAVDHNIKEAQRLLDDNKTQLELLVLPELAFSGYNFKSLDHITPYLEPTTAGPTTQWAKFTAHSRQCTVIVGYPEIATFRLPDGTTTTRNFNSTVTVNREGAIVHNYRKSFLYYTDELWASEGHPSTQSGQPFFTGSLGPGLLDNVGHGICMDINPYKFMPDRWTDYEFANTMLAADAKLIVLSMAWLTRLTESETQINPERPDFTTVAYWLDRFHPLIERRPQDSCIVVFANRCGAEGTVLGHVQVEDGHTVEMGDRVAYAGSSCVMKIEGGAAKLWGRYVGTGTGEVALMGKCEEGLMVVETNQAAAFQLQHAL